MRTIVCPQCGASFEDEDEPLEPTLADRTAMSVRVYWETREWSASRFRAALVEARLR